jgi:hypothetical protein
MLFENTYHSEVIKMGADWVAAFDRLSFIIKRDASKIYASDETAKAYFKAMGTKGIDTCELSAIFVAALNACASIVGRPVLGDIVPDGFVLIPNEDGTVTPIFNSPQSSSSSSGE